MVSILSSVIEEEKKKLNEGNFGYEYSKTDDMIVDAPKFTHEDFSKIAKGLSKDYHVILKRTLMKEKDKHTEIQIIYSKNDKTLSVPILQGRNLNAKNKNEIIVGRKLASRWPCGKTIEILGENYLVAGVVGREDDRTVFDNLVLAYGDNLGEKVKKHFDELNKVNTNDYLPYVFTIINDKVVKSGDVKKVKKAFEVIPKANVKEFCDDEGFKSSVGKSLDNKKEDIFGDKLLILVGIANVIVASTFWIRNRKKEIAIRKAFGAKNSDIVKLIFKELSFLVVLSAGIAILLQFTALKIFKDYFGMSLKLSLMNLIGLVIMSFLLSLVASSIPIYRVLKIDVNKTLKE